MFDIWEYLKLCFGLVGDNSRLCCSQYMWFYLGGFLEEQDSASAYTGRQAKIIF